MSSLYYGCSPYLNRNKKTLFRKRNRSYSVAAAPRRRSGSWLGFGKKASKDVALGLVKTGAVVKESTTAFKRAFETARNIKSGKMKFEIGPGVMILGLVVISVSMSLLYLAHYNSVATKGYDLRRLEADRRQLMTQHDIKNMKLAEAKSLAVISASDKVGNMRRPGNVAYVQGSMAIASR